jgi:hypothetical protein
MIVHWMTEGIIIPFFGAGVNLAGRSAGTPFTPKENLPRASELSLEIAHRFGYPWDDRENLLRVSWYAARNGGRELYKFLHDLFSASYQTNEVHKFFAELPSKLAAKGYRHCRQLIVTTNYDQMLERAFDDAGEPYDVLSYVAWSDEEYEKGKFRYTPHRGKPTPVLTPATLDLPIEENVLERNIILKIHGAVDGSNQGRSSFVITEDDYIDYLARMNPASQVPALLMEKMKDSSFLFLGYSLGDWNLRVFLHSLWSNQPRNDTSWAVMNETKDWDEEYWRRHRVDLWKLSLSDYVEVLREELDALPVVGGAVTI